MKILNTDDILEAVTQDQIPDTEELVDDVIRAVEALASRVAAHYGIAVLETTWEGKDFGGLCADFVPAREGQPCPDMIDQADPGGGWDPPIGPSPSYSGPL